MRKERKLRNILILGTEIIVTFVLGIILLNATRKPIFIYPALSEFTSDYLQYQDDSWSVADGELTLDEPVTLLTSQNIELSAGSYTIVLKYNAKNQVNCELSSAEGKEFLHANVFALSRNKTNVDYDFYVTRKITDLRVNITNYQNNAFLLNGVEIYSNSHNLRLLLFIWIVTSIFIDVILYSKFWSIHKDIFKILIMIALLASVPSFMDGLGVGHDLPFHLARIDGIAQGLKSGQFPVRMNGLFNDGYGYPVDIFYGDVLLYIPAILRLIGFTVVSAYKIYVFVINLLTALSCYYCGKEIFNHKKIGLVVSASYTLASYRMLDIWTRGAVGEYTSMIFLPVIALALWKIYVDDIKSNEYKRNALLLAGGMLGLLYTHILSIEMATFVIVGIAMVLLKKTLRKETFCVLLGAVVIFVLVGLAFLVPFVDYYLNTDTMVKASSENMHYIQDRGAYISDYFSTFKNVLGGSSTDSAQRMQLSPGLVLISALVIAIFLIAINKATRKIKIFTVGSCLLLLLASNLFPWNQLAASSRLGNMFGTIQFPWRYIGIALVFLALLLGAVIQYGIEMQLYNEKLLYATAAGVFVTFTIFLSMYSNGIVQCRTIDTAELAQYTGGSISATNGEEYLLQNTDISNLDYEITSENGTTTVVNEDGLDMLLAIQSADETWIEIPRFDYPNYVATDEEGNKLKITTGTNNKIKIWVPEAYSGEVKVIYEVPWYWRFSEIISFIAAMVVLAVVSIYVNRKHTQ